MKTLLQATLNHTGLPPDRLYSYTFTPQATPGLSTPESARIFLEQNRNILFPVLLNPENLPGFKNTIQRHVLTDHDYFLTVAQHTLVLLRPHIKSFNL